MSKTLFLALQFSLLMASSTAVCVAQPASEGATNREVIESHTDGGPKFPALKHGVLFRLDSGQTFKCTNNQVSGDKTTRLYAWDHTSGKKLQDLGVGNDAWEYTNSEAKPVYIFACAGCKKSGTHLTCQYCVIHQAAAGSAFRFGFDEDYLGRYRDLLVDIEIVGVKQPESNKK